MTPAERSIAEQQCLRLIAEYCRRVDELSEERVGDLFTEDGVIENNGVVTEGREALRALPRGSERGLFMRHLSTSAVVDILDDDRATGLSYFMAFVEPPGTTELPLPFAVGHYRDEFRRTGDGWRFSRRTVHTDLRRPEQA